MQISIRNGITRFSVSKPEMKKLSQAYGILDDLDEKCHVLGARAAKDGIKKVFETLLATQMSAANKAVQESKRSPLPGQQELPGMPAEEAAQDTPVAEQPQQEQDDINYDRLEKITL